MDSITKDDVITFSTSKFSTYALGYNDKNVSSNTGSVDDNFNETNDTTLNPQTSDNSQLFLWSAILCSASVCILGLLVYVKRKAK
ncbi:sortase B protein-sorting domain-containing protein [Anaerofustis sp. LCP19S3_F7]|uniref:sortase B protein-sorting domain-containing protein n=1 Tax=Anaerofustis sp. LCP19S3_F7 TaxID=3440247 RepID=UPI003F8E31BE